MKLIAVCFLAIAFTHNIEEERICVIVQGLTIQHTTLKISSESVNHPIKPDLNQALISSFSRHKVLFDVPGLTLIQASSIHPKILVPTLEIKTSRLTILPTKVPTPDRFRYVILPFA